MRIKVVSKGFKVDGGALEYAPGFVFTSDRDCREYDWLVAYDDLAVPERLACPATRTILATCEPVSIKGYSRAFTRQFAYLLTNRPSSAEGHPGYWLGRGYYKWFIGRSHAEAAAWALPPKTKVMSAVCSSKNMRHTDHRKRLSLLSALAKTFPELDWYGRGVKPFGAKYEVMDPYRYQVVVENHIAPHHWTEKLTDAFLSECLPFYAGAPDVADDFPPESIIPIPLNDPSAAARIIRQAIAGGEYDKRRDAVLEAKRRVLDRYNFYAQVIELIESVRAGAVAGFCPQEAVIYPRKALRRRSPVAAIEDGLIHVRQFLGIGRKGEQA